MAIRGSNANKDRLYVGYYMRPGQQDLHVVILLTPKKSVQDKDTPDTIQYNAKHIVAAGADGKGKVKWAFERSVVPAISPRLIARILMGKIRAEDRQRLDDIFKGVPMLKDELFDARVWAGHAILEVVHAGLIDAVDVEELDRMSRSLTAGKLPDFSAPTISYQNHRAL